MGELELVQEVLRNITSISPRIKVADDHVTVKYRLGYTETREITVAVQELTALLKANPHTFPDDQLVLESATYFEVPLRLSSRRTLFSQNDILKLEDPDLGVTYEISGPSGNFTAPMIAKLVHHGLSRFEWKRLGVRMLTRVSDDSVPATVAWRAIGAFQPVQYTLIIRRMANIGTLPAFGQLADALLFQLSYNSGITFSRISTFEDVVSSLRISKVGKRRTNPSQIDPPRRTYTADLVYHYQMALASDSPFQQYLSFYHVLEHFFEEVYADELAQAVKGTLTSPAFSYRRRSDLDALVRQVQKLTRKQKDGLPIDEARALELTLVRFVDNAAISAELEQYDSSLKEYYRTSSVDFANAGPVDFAETSSQALRASIAARIYQVRNALVHSKQGKRAKYVPFQHDRELTREMPLIRFVAEEVILKNSVVIA